MSTNEIVEREYSKYGFHDADAKYVFQTQKGLSKEVVEAISGFKKEPKWMTDFRLRSLDIFLKKPMPDWGSPLLKNVDFDDIYYYMAPTARGSDNWEDVPDYIKKTFDKLGIPEAEKKFLGGVGAQYDSEVVYHKVDEPLVSGCGKNREIIPEGGLFGRHGFCHHHYLRGLSVYRCQLS